MVESPFGRAGWTLTLCGKTGLGKTMLAEAVLESLGADAWGFCSKVEPVQRNGRVLRLTWEKHDWRRVSDGFKSGDWYVDDMEQCGLLVLDDIGADHDPSKAATAKLDRILRTRRGRWTVVTSNLDGQQMRDQLDARIASFLNRDSNLLVEVTGRDFSERPL